MRFAAHLTKSTEPTTCLKVDLTEIDTEIDFSSCARIVYTLKDGVWIFSDLIPSFQFSNPQSIERAGRILVAISKMHAAVNHGPLTLLTDINKSWGKQVVYDGRVSKWVSVGKIKQTSAKWKIPGKDFVDFSSSLVDMEEARKALIRQATEIFIEAHDTELATKAMSWIKSGAKVESIQGEAPVFLSIDDLMVS